MAKWRFVLTDAGFTPLGEILNASDRKIALPLNKLDTLSFRVRLDNPLADWLMSTACYVKAYRDSSLLYYGSLISAEETGDAGGASIAVNSVSAGWVLAKRLAGKSAVGQVFSVATDRAQIVKALIDTTNAENETGISTSGPISASSEATYTAGPYRPINDIVTELSASFDGFDWRVTPLDNYSNGAVTGQKIGMFYAAPTIGIEQPNAVFEWGTGRHNISSYKRVVSRDTQANKVYHFTSNGPDAPAYPTVSAIDAGSISDYRLLEDLAQADLVDATLRQRLVDEHVRIRRWPRQVIEFEPHVDPGVTGRVPSYGADYSVGDSVRARVVYGASTRVDAMLRVWGVTFDIDDSGLEKASLTLAEE